MCQIIAGQSAKIRSTLLETHGLIADLYRSNSDGLGVMYSTTKGLKIVKVVPKTIADVQRLITNLPQDDRNLTMHWRYATHGKTDMTNCHPYTVVPGKVAMVHNGVLDTGNAADRSKSDTWHFIKDYLAEPATACPDVVHADGFAKLVGEFIGNNRFVFMTEDGRMTIVNKDQGLEHDGMWFANTYAWSPELLIPGYRPKFRYSQSSYLRGGYGLDDDDDLYGFQDYKHGSAQRSTGQGVDWSKPFKSSSPTPALPAPVSTVATMYPGNPATIKERFFEDLVDAVLDGEADETAKLIRTRPTTSVEYLVENYVPTVVRSIIATGLSGGEQVTLTAVFDACAEGQSPEGREATLKTLVDIAIATPIRLAQVICYYIEWAPLVASDEYDDEQYEDDGTGVYDHKGHQIVVTEEQHGVFAYEFSGPLGSDTGFGFMEAYDALDWATNEIDHLIDAAVHETSH